MKKTSIIAIIILSIIFVQQANAQTGLPSQIPTIKKYLGSYDGKDVELFLAVTERAKVSGFLKIGDNKTEIATGGYLNSGEVKIDFKGDDFKQLKGTHQNHKKAKLNYLIDGVKQTKLKLEIQNSKNEIDGSYKEKTGDYTNNSGLALYKLNENEIYFVGHWKQIADSGSNYTGSYHGIMTKDTEKSSENEIVYKYEIKLSVTPNESYGFFYITLSKNSAILTVESSNDEITKGFTDNKIEFVKY